jgi:hypothetical protein
VAAPLPGRRRLEPAAVSRLRRSFSADRRARRPHGSVRDAVADSPLGRPNRPARTVTVRPLSRRKGGTAGPDDAGPVTRVPRPPAGKRSATAAQRRSATELQSLFLHLHPASAVAERQLPPRPPRLRYCGQRSRLWRVRARASRALSPPGAAGQRRHPPLPRPLAHSRVRLLTRTRRTHCVCGSSPPRRLTRRPVGRVPSEGPFPRAGKGRSDSSVHTEESASHWTGPSSCARRRTLPLTQARRALASIGRPDSHDADASVGHHCIIFMGFSILDGGSGTSRSTVEVETRHTAGALADAGGTRPRQSPGRHHPSRLHA